MKDLFFIFKKINCVEYEISYKEKKFEESFIFDSSNENNSIIDNNYFNKNKN